MRLLSTMLGFRRRQSGRDLVGTLHERVVDASREPPLYEEGGLPDTTEGRFESLTLHALLALRRLRQLPPPADDVAQELVDLLFAHLEIALREMGVGDFGVPKRMKKLAGAFYDRTHRYDALLDAKDAAGLAAEIATRLEADPEGLIPVARHLLRVDAALRGASLDTLLTGDSFPPRDASISQSKLEGGAP
jgi:cytochrome b pre-mRNA-processing protein 3